LVQVQLAGLLREGVFQVPVDLGPYEVVRINENRGGDA